MAISEDGGFARGRPEVPEEVLEPVEALRSRGHAVPGGGEEGGPAWTGGGAVALRGGRESRSSGARTIAVRRGGSESGSGGKFQSHRLGWFVSGVTEILLHLIQVNRFLHFPRNLLNVSGKFLARVSRKGFASIQRGVTPERQSTVCPRAAAYAGLSVPQSPRPTIHPLNQTDSRHQPCRIPKPWRGGISQPQAHSGHQHSQPPDP
jgi:hypothetical protein